MACHDLRYLSGPIQSSAFLKVYLQHSIIAELGNKPSYACGFLNAAMHNDLAKVMDQSSLCCRRHGKLHASKTWYC